MLYYSVDSAVKGSTERTTMSVLWTHGCNIAAAAAAGLTRRRGTSRQSRESGALKPAKLKRRRRNSSYRFHSPSYLESHHSPPPLPCFALAHTRNTHRRSDQERDPRSHSTPRRRHSLGFDVSRAFRRPFTLLRRPHKRLFNVTFYTYNATWNN